MKKLYQADGHAVKEMLKIATFLHNALKLKQSGDEDFRSVASIDLSTKVTLIYLYKIEIFTNFSILFANSTISAVFGLDTRAEVDPGISFTNNAERIFIIRAVEQGTGLAGL